MQQNTKIVKVGYILVVTLIILNVFMFFDAVDSFRYSPLGMWLVFAIDVPLGIILFLLARFINNKDENKTNIKKVILNSGFVMGLLLPIISIVLFLLTDKS